MPAEAFVEGRSDGEGTTTVELPRSVVAHTAELDTILKTPDIARLIWEHSGDLVAVLNPNTQILHINRMGEKLTGRQRTDCIGKPFTFLLHSEDRNRAQAALEESLRGRGSPVEVRLCSAGEKSLRFSLAGTPIYNPQHEMIGLLSIAHDITRLRQAEEEVRRQNEILVALNSIGQDLASPSEPYNLLRRSLKTLTEILQLDTGAVLRLHRPIPRAESTIDLQGPHMVCHRPDPDEPGPPCPCADQDIAGEVLQVPDSGVRAATLCEIFSGAEFPFHICLPLISHTHVEGFLHLAARRRRQLSEVESQTLRSVGTQIGVVLENSRLYQSLQSQVERFKALMKASRNILSQKSLSTTLEAIISEAVRILRADRCAVYLRKSDGSALECALATGLSTEYIRFVLGQLEHLPGRALLERPEPLVVEDLRELPEIAEMAAREGVCTVALFPLETRDELLGAIAFYHDAPRRYSPSDLEIGQLFGHQVAIAVQNAWQFEEARRRAVEVEAKNRELEEFISIASHDLRSPLISIEGFMARFVQSYGEQLDDEGRRYLGRVAENTHYMYTLIQSLLDLSRASTQSEPLLPLSLEEIVAEVLRNVEPALEESGAQVVIRPLPGLLGDRVRIRQVFTNLVDNAIKYAHPERALRIEVGYEPPDIYVRDNGLGIPPDKRQAIFDSLFRLHEVVCDGLGMGLSIVKRVVEGHRGTIWVESDGRSGSTFFLRFPSGRLLTHGSGNDR